MKTATLLCEESEFYDTHKEELLKEYLNMFVLIHHRELVGAYESEEEAIREGAVRFAGEPFLVRRTGEEVPVLTLPALNMGIAPCP